MRRAALLLALAACKTSSEVKSEAHAETLVEKQLYEEGRAASSGQDHSGPWTERIYEFEGPPSGPAAKEGASTQRADGLATVTSGITTRGGVALSVQPDVNLPDHGPLVKVTVRDYQGRDVTWNTQSEGLRGAETSVQASAEAEAAKKDESAPAGILGGLGAILGGLWPLLIVGLIVAFGWAVWRFYVKPRPSL